MSEAEQQRIDRWLWHARILRTRSLAARFAASGKLRVNGTRIAKPSHPVAPGDVLTFALNGQVKVLEIVAIAERRGPYAEARLTYHDLSPPPSGEPPPAAPPARPAGSGRPTKRERRQLDSLARDHE